MPSRTDKIPINDSFLDRRIKMLPCQKEMVVVLHQRGATINGIARMYGVSKRLIQFILFPERKQRNIEARRERGGSKIYYKKNYHTEKMREHRHYKNKIL